MLPVDRMDTRGATDPVVEAVRPILAAELGEDAELVELSALMTCRNSPAGSSSVRDDNTFFAAQLKAFDRG